MQVRYVYPMGDAGWEQDVVADSVPRQGDYVVGPDDEQYTVNYVAWHPWGLEEDANRTDKPECRVLVILKTHAVPKGYVTTEGVTQRRTRNIDSDGGPG